MTLFLSQSRLLCQPSATWVRSNAHDKLAISRRSQLRPNKVAFIGIKKQRRPFRYHVDTGALSQAGESSKWSSAASPNEIAGILTSIPIDVIPGRARSARMCGNLLASDLAEVKKLVAAGDRFCELMEQYIRLITDKTRCECQVLGRRPMRRRAKVDSRLKRGGP